MRFHDICESYISESEERPATEMPIEISYRRKPGAVRIQKRVFQFRSDKQDFYHSLPDDAIIYYDGDSMRKGDIEGRYKED